MTVNVLRTLPIAGVAALTALTLAACGSGGSSNNPAPAAGSTPAPTGTAGGGGGQRQPGVNGLIAAVNGSTMQVQTRTDQTAVTWTDSTTFTKVDSAALADVTVGSCVTVLEPPTASSEAAPSSAPATQVTAGSVEVRAATNGQCTGGFGGGFGGPGGRPGGTASAGATPPAGAPTGTATGAAGGRGGNVGRGAFGLVTAVSGDTITVQETLGGRGTATATASPTSTTVTVTTTGSTTFTAQKAAAASDVAVGECTTAMGKADDTGAVTATAISLRPATNGACTTGFGGPGGRPGATGTATTGGTNG